MFPCRKKPQRMRKVHQHDHGVAEGEMPAEIFDAEPVGDERRRERTARDSWKARTGQSHTLRRPCAGVRGNASFSSVVMAARWDNGAKPSSLRARNALRVCVTCHLPCRCRGSPCSPWPSDATAALKPVVGGAGSCRSPARRPRRVRRIPSASVEVARLLHTSDLALLSGSGALEPSGKFSDGIADRADDARGALLRFGGRP